MNTAVELVESASVRWAYLTESALLAQVLPPPMRAKKDLPADGAHASRQHTLWRESARFHSLSSERKLLNKRIIPRDRRVIQWIVPIVP